MSRLLCLILLALFPWAASAQGSPRLGSLVPELHLRTTFAHDFGDQLDAVVFRGVDYTPAEASEKILPLLDWKTRSDQLELGQAWVEEFVLFGWAVVRPGDSRYRDLEGPKAVLLADGTLRYTAWAVSMRGRSPGGNLTCWQVDIHPDGRVSKTALESPELNPLDRG